MTTPITPQPLSKRWRIHPLIPDYVDAALREGEFTPLMRQLLFNRGFEESQAALDFVKGTVSFSTDPFLLTGMTAAVTRLHRAVTEGEAIVIYGDYDADGVTSSALLFLFLRAIGAAVRVYIPNRADEGYGLNDEAIRELAGEGTPLMITVDCGIRAVEEVTLANQLGMDVIISDHHQPGAVLPPATAVIDPKQAGDLYPEKFLAGVGLAYKLAQAYLTRYPQPGVDADDWLDLVAIGTVADIAPLKGENRLLVKMGLEKIRQRPRQGLYSLANVAGIDLKKCDTGNIGFGLGPRLNAAGRLESAMSAFELLTEDDIFKAGQLAQALDLYNSERQELTELIRDQAAQQVLEENPDAPLFFAADPSFNKGVVGLAASRLTEAYYRPAIIGHQDGEFTVASCRSIDEFHITNALDACADLLVRHGGHAAAAGFTVRNENVDALVTRMTALVIAELGETAPLPVLDIDREIKLEKLAPGYIPGILDDLHQLEPTGRGNPEPIFASKDVGVRFAKVVGREGAHLKLTLQAGKYTYDAIAFRQGYWLAEMPERIDLAYRFEVNEFNGRSTLQLNVKDIKPSE